VDVKELIDLLEFRKSIQKVPASIGHTGATLSEIIETISRPVDGSQSHWIESLGIPDRGLIVIPKDRKLATPHDDVQAFAGIRAVTHDIAQANNFIDFLRGNIVKDSR
jgi:hypothetical protein